MYRLVKKIKPVAWPLVGVVLLAVVVIISTRPHQAYQVPANIKSRLGFPALFLENSARQYSVNTKSIKYAQINTDTSIFSFIIQTPNNSISITEQAYPEVLIYDKLTNSIQPYSEVGSAYGQVTLGRPKDGGGKQAAVLKYGDATLIFAKPVHDLSDADWQYLFNSLDVVK